MNAAKTLSLEPFQDKPQCRPVTAVSIRLPQHYFQSLLSSVSLDWAGNEKAWNVLCCVYIRNNFVLKVWLILLPFGPRFPSCSSPHFFSPLPCFPWANWQQQGFKGDAAWLFRCSELSKNKQLLLLLLALWSHTPANYLGEKSTGKKVQDWERRFNRRRIKTSLFVHQPCHGLIWYNCTRQGITAWSWIWIFSISTASVQSDNYSCSWCIKWIQKVLLHTVYSS